MFDIVQRRKGFDPLTCKIAVLFYFVGWGKSINIGNISVFKLHVGGLGLRKWIENAIFVAHFDNFY